MSLSVLGKYKIAINTASLTDGDSIASYLVDAAGNLLTSTTFGAKQRLDVDGPSDHVDGSAYTATTDFLTAVSAVDNSGNYKPLNLDASGNLKVSGSFTTSFTAEHNEDDPFTNGDSGIATLLVRQDTLASSTSADGDYGSFKSNSLGELYVHDTDVKAQLVSANSTLTGIKSDTASIVTSSGTTATNTSTIVTNTGTIATNTGTTATNTGSISSTLTALSKAEDAAHANADQGIQMLAVRKDAQGTNVSTDGDYSSLLTWSEGSLKVVDVANGTILQQQVSVTSTAAQVPAANLANRKSLMLQNTSSGKMSIGSSTVTTTGATAGIELPGNSFLELECGPAVNVFAVKTGAGSLNLNVLEMA